MVHTIGYEDGEKVLDWAGLLRALEEGHALPKASVEDSFLYRGKDTVLSRAAWIDGLGVAVKTATIFPGNLDVGKPSIGGAVTLFSDRDGSLEAVIDFHLVTKWKTAGDSLWAAKMLAPDRVERILIVGAGTLARGVREAFGAGYPGAEFEVWNRTGAGAEAMAAAYPATRATADLRQACGRAEIIVTTTMATEPIIQGSWLRPGSHLNLIGAYRPDMREVDDAALLRSRIFVDSFDTTLGHIGEIKIPLESGIISREQVLGDYYDRTAFSPAGSEEITLFKNGGGAHLDLMTCRYILSRWTG